MDETFGIYSCCCPSSSAICFCCYPFAFAICLCHYPSSVIRLCRCSLLTYPSVGKQYERFVRHARNKTVNILLQTLPLFPYLRVFVLLFRFLPLLVRLHAVFVRFPVLLPTFLPHCHAHLIAGFNTLHSLHIVLARRRCGK